MELEHLQTYQKVIHRMYLLIVPYGIETAKALLNRFQQVHLLIVPYGIETVMDKVDKGEKLTFNRTLWN